MFSHPLASQGIEFFHGSWEEALEIAEEQDKLIFIDAYASWCGPCKRMSQNVFPLEDVGEVFNNNFINVKLDMEKPEALEFRRNHSVSAYPTLFFVNGKNEEVHKSVGGKTGPQLIQLASEALSLMDDLEALTTEYEAGERNANFVYRYVRALIRQGQPHLRVANDYLRTQSGALDQPENLRLILLAATNTDSRIFQLLVDHQTNVIAATSREQFEEQVRMAAKNSMSRAVEFRDADLLGEAADQLKKVLPQEVEAFELEGELRLMAVGVNARDFFKAARDYHRKVASKEREQLRWLYMQLVGSKFLSDSKVMDLAETVGWEYAEPSEDFADLYRLADFLRAQGRASAALRAAEMCLDRLPEGDANRRRAVNALIERIEQAN